MARELAHALTPLLVLLLARRHGLGGGRVDAKAAVAAFEGAVLEGHARAKARLARALHFLCGAAAALVVPD